MAQQVINGAALACTFGAAPGTLSVIPLARTQVGGGPAAAIMDFQPMVNIAAFGVCLTPTNPQVAAATAAALGVLTPQPCMPMITAPWAPGSPTVMVGGQPALNSASTCMCMWGGQISVVVPGQITTHVA